ncbi:DUF3597 domain-containing protein [Pseudomonas bohemica]|uniref:DUF3597 domain-containing protein n=1 Tax=Pseudomonas bohemica TaxID=2044872 RepID=UPI000DA62C8C|nr:DUF3597 domain-containing protein [Pseudomonas bohemica]
MSFFNKILSALGIGHADASTQTASDPSVAQPQGTTTPVTGAPTTATTTATPVDVSAKLEALSAQHPGLNWRTSIVDLLKVLGLDSSLENRKQLAADVGLGAYEGTAEQNQALHKAVLRKLAENGGNVPAELHN